MTCGISVPRPGGSNPWQWKYSVLTTGPPENSLICFLIPKLFVSSFSPNTASWEFGMTCVFFPALFNLCWGQKILKPQSYCVYFFSEKEILCESDLRTQSSYGWRYAGRQGVWGWQRADGRSETPWGRDRRPEERRNWRLEKTPRRSRCVQRCHPRRAAERRSTWQTPAEEMKADFSVGNFTAKATSPRKPTKGKRYAVAWHWIWWLRSEQRMSYANTG